MTALGHHAPHPLPEDVANKVRTTSSDDWRATVAVIGEFDLANCHQLRDELQSHIDAGRTVIKVDARNLRFLDSWALSELLTAHERCQAGQGSLVLTGLPRHQLRVLHLLGLEQVMLIDPSASP